MTPFEQPKPFSSPPEVEALSDLSWKRIEQQVFLKLEQEPLPEPGLEHQRSVRPRQSSTGRAGLVMMAAAAAIALFIAWPKTSVAPTEVVAPQRSRVVTQSAASQVVVGDATIEIAPSSAILIDRAGDDISVTLDTGSVSLKVAPRNERAPIVVHSGEVRVEVVGTEFAVYRDHKGTRVTVSEGVVSVIAEGKRSSVAAGQQWPTAQPTEKQVKHSPPKRQARADKATPGKAQPSARELFEQAGEYELSSPEAAIALYKQVAAGGGDWAANALYAHGRLEHSRSNYSEATRLLTRYLAKFPKGANAQDAKELLDAR